MKLPNPQMVKLFVRNKALQGLKILHLSDLHISQKTSQHFIENLVNICHALPYDIAVLTGDIIDCKAEHILPQLLALNQLQRTFYISGNHDLFYGIKRLNAILCNFTFLDNQHVFIEHHQQKIALVGISDRFSSFFGIKRDEKKSLAFLQKTANAILLAHQPKDYLLALKSDTPLFLCGHTHGGQIFPFGYIVKLFQPFIQGIHYKNNTTIYVNKGLGTWGIHTRYKTPSEITLLELYSSCVHLF
jgi:predicted MPP superfamily phosphohydrolase